MHTKVILINGFYKKIILCSLVLVTGCATTIPVEPPKDDDRVLSILNLHASRVSSGVEKMVTAEGAMRESTKQEIDFGKNNSNRKEKAIVSGAVAGKVSSYDSDKYEAADLNTIPNGLGVKVFLSNNLDVYTADIETVIDRVCDLTGWSKGVSKGVPLSPIIVTVPSKNDSAFILLVRLGAKLNRSADLIISEETKTITISYPVK